MALKKVEYIDNETVITAEQMNAIQDAIVDNETELAKKLPLSGGTMTGTLTLDSVRGGLQLIDTSTEGVAATGGVGSDGIPYLEFRGTYGDECVRIVGLVDPVESGDVATKGYVDNAKNNFKLIDRATGKTVTLYVSEGKLMVEESNT